MQLCFVNKKNREFMCILQHFYAISKTEYKNRWMDTFELAYINVALR